MINFEQVIDRYRIEAEKNGTNDAIASDNLRVSLLYNRAQNKFLTLHLQNRGIDDVRYIQKFLILDKRISHSYNTQTRFDFKLPKDYFDLADVRANAEKDKCKREINLVEMQTENLNEVLQDEFNKPSFEWDEAPFTINSDQLSIYVDNFTISEILLNYYRYPSQIRLINEQDPESKFTANSLVEWDDKSLDDIISLMVFNLDINTNNQRFQLQTLKIQK